MSAAARFLSRTRRDGACLVWTGPLDKGGYAVRSSTRVHIAVWEWLNGRVPAGLELDHTCNRRPCINPKHLEAVTHAENCRRAAARRKTCRAGHRLTGDNVRTWRNGRTVQRICVECYRVRYERRHGHRPPELVAA